MELATAYLLIVHAVVQLGEGRSVFDGLVLASSVRRSTAEVVFHFGERFHGASWTREGQDVWMQKVSR